MRLRSIVFPGFWAALAACSSSNGAAPGTNDGGGGSGGGGGGGCSASALTCGDVLPGATLTALQPSATGYMESGTLPCHFTLPSSSGGIVQAFCGGADLLSQQLAIAEGAYPGDATETDTIGAKSFELVVGPPNAVGSTAEVAAVTTNGKYVFNVSLSSAAADIMAARALARAIDTNLSAR